jgi:hypothetical protein
VEKGRKERKKEKENIECCTPQRIKELKTNLL